MTTTPSRTEADTDSRHASIRQIIVDALTSMSSPTVDRGDSHGARGQPGWIIWASSIDFIAAQIARETAVAAPDPIPDPRDAALATALDALRGARLIFETLPVPANAGETVRRALARRGDRIKAAVRLLERMV